MTKKKVKPDLRVEAWRGYWNETAKNISAFKINIGMCRVLLCSRPAIINNQMCKTCIDRHKGNRPKINKQCPFFAVIQERSHRQEYVTLVNCWGRAKDIVNADFAKDITRVVET